MSAGLIITIVVGAAGIIDYIRSLDLACSYSDTLARGDLTQDVEQKYLDRKDSIGNLAAAFHKIRESFAGPVSYTHLSPMSCISMFPEVPWIQARFRQYGKRTH